MTASRLLAGLIQPLLALLLLAGLPADRLRAQDRALVHGIEGAAKAIGSHRERAAVPSDARFEPHRSDGDDGPDAAAVAPEPALPALDAGRLRWVPAATAPSSHRPCAAPST